MKKTLLGLALTAALLATGCNQSSPKKSLGETTKDIERVLRPAEYARANIKMFGKICKDSLRGKLPIQGYTIRSLDLLMAMGIADTALDSNEVLHKFVRVYLGYDTSNKVHAGFKLYILPVDSAYLGGDDSSKWIAGYDLLLDSLGKAIHWGHTTTTTTPYVLDLNAPCPNTCSTNQVVN